MSTLSLVFYQQPIVFNLIIIRVHQGRAADQIATRTYPELEFTTRFNSQARSANAVESARNPMESQVTDDDAIRTPKSIYGRSGSRADKIRLDNLSSEIAIAGNPKVMKKSQEIVDDATQSPESTIYERSDSRAGEIQMHDPSTEPN